MFKILALLLSGVKFSKLLTTGGTMLLSIATYAIFYGWQFALGFVLLIFVHEMGHYLAARQRGLDVGAPTFIPFLGAWIELKDKPHDAETEAYVGLAGPLVGTLGALACYYLGRSQDSGLLLALAYSGFFLNLFNLIPLSPFDGGRVTAAISPRLWLLGVPILAAFFIYRPSPILFFIALMAAPHVMKAWRFRGQDDPDAAYYQVKPSVRLEYAVYYLGLMVFLALMMQGTHELLGSYHPH